MLDTWTTKLASEDVTFDTQLMPTSCWTAVSWQGDSNVHCRTTNLISNRKHLVAYGVKLESGLHKEGRASGSSNC